MASYNIILLHTLLILQCWCILNSIFLGTYVGGPKDRFRLSLDRIQSKLQLTIDGSMYDCHINGELRNISSFTVKHPTKRKFNVVDDYTILVTEQLRGGGVHYFYETKHRISEIAVIVNDAPRTHYEMEILNNTQRFLDGLFPTSNPFINYWTPVHTGLCKKTKNYRSWGISRAKQHGIAIVHSEVWKDFHNRPIDLLNISVVANKNLYDPNYGEDVILIFEADNICLLEDGCGEAILHDVASMTTDLMYLGWCYPYNFLADFPVPPLCLHAYVLTRSGARTFAGNTDTCDIAIDEQIRKFCYETGFPWTNATYRIEETRNNGTPLGAFHGIITQNRTRW